MTAAANNTPQTPDGALKARNRRVALAGLGFAVAMVGVAYASVPLYRIFCQVTGYGGTTQQAEAGSDVVLARAVTVRFDANVAGGINWTFKPAQEQITLKIGATKLAFYSARNDGSKRITGTATFNVSPQAAGQYFSKIECFCFTEQSLEPGEKVEMPVSFFIDPEFDQDPDLMSVKTITLSYTFFPVKPEAAAATSAVNNAKPVKRVN